MLECSYLDTWNVRLNSFNKKKQMLLFYCKIHSALKVHNTFYCDTNNNSAKKNAPPGCISIHPGLSQYFVEPPFDAHTTVSLLVYVSPSVAHLETEIFAHLSLP